MENLICVFTVSFVISFLFGVIYPLLAIMIYPIYKFLGGKQDFKEYIRSL